MQDLPPAARHRDIGAELKDRRQNQPQGTGLAHQLGEPLQIPEVQKRRDQRSSDKQA